MFMMMMMTNNKKPFLQLQFLPYTEYSLSQSEKTDFSASHLAFQTTQLFELKIPIWRDAKKPSRSVPVIFVQLWVILKSIRWKSL